MLHTKTLCGESFGTSNTTKKTLKIEQNFRKFHTKIQKEKQISGEDSLVCSGSALPVAISSGGITLPLPSGDTIQYFYFFYEY